MCYWNIHFVIRHSSLCSMIWCMKTHQTSFRKTHKQHIIFTSLSFVIFHHSSLIIITSFYIIILRHYQLIIILHHIFVYLCLTHDFVIFTSYLNLTPTISLIFILHILLPVTHFNFHLVCSFNPHILLLVYIHLINSLTLPLILTLTHYNLTTFLSSLLFKAVMFTLINYP